MKNLRHLLVYLSFTLICFHLHAANRYWVASSSGNWSTKANWSTTSGGAGGANVPVAADVVYFNGNGLGNCIIDLPVSITTLSINSSYTGTIIQGANTIIVSGASTFGGGTFSGGSAAMTMGGAFTISGAAFTSTSDVLELRHTTAFSSGTFIHNNGSVRFNGIGTASPNITGTLPAFYNLEFVGLAKTYTLSASGIADVANTFTISGSLACTLNTGTINIAGDINITNTATGGGGTATVNINGTGNQNYNGGITAGSGALPKLTINKVSGILNLSGFPSVTNTFTYTAGTINPGSSTLCFVRMATNFTISGTPVVNNISIIANTAFTLTIANTITATGDLVIDGTANITLNTGTINVEGNLATINTSTGSGGTATIRMSGAGSQSITSSGVSGQGRLPDFTIDKSGGNLVFPALLTIIGDLTYIAGTLDATTNNSTVVLANTLSIAGTFTLNNVIFDGSANRTFTITTGSVLTTTGTLTLSGSSSITLNTGSVAGTNIIQAQGNIDINNSSTGTGGTGGILINGSATQAITSTVIAGQGKLPYITIQKTGGALTLTGIISESRHWTYTSGTVDAITNSSTVVFGGNALTITSAGMSFNHTIFSASTITLANNLTVAGNLTISGSSVLTPGANTINLSGDWIGRGNAGLTEATSTVNFNGTTLQTISSSGVETFANTIINNSAGIQLSSNTIAATSLNMNAGNINLGGNTLTIGSSASVPGTLTYTTGNITGAGSLVRWVRSGVIAAGSAAGLFPMGTPTNNRSLYFSAPTTGPSTGGTITVSYNDAGSNSAVTFPDGVAVVLVRKDLNWTVSTANGLAGGTYNLQIRGTGFGSIGSVADLRVTLVAGVIGTAGTNAGTTSNPQVNRTGLSLASLSNSFYLASVNATNSALPVTLISFTTRVINDKVQLDWQTADELNNDRFIIQRSKNSMDWADMKIIKGAGNSTTVLFYKANDDDPLDGLSYYRLLQVDIDGKKTYSNVRTVLINNKISKINVYPNPAIDYVVIESSADTKSDISLFNNSGQKMNNHVMNDGNKIKIDLTAVPPGIYCIQITQGNAREIRKITVMK